MIVFGTFLTFFTRAQGNFWRGTATTARGWGEEGWKEKQQKEVHGQKGKTDCEETQRSVWPLPRNTRRGL